MSDEAILERLLSEWLDREPGDTVESFIARHSEHEDLLREHFAMEGLAAHAFVPRPDLPETLGPFRIEKELGSGGMGSVYRAVVAEPVRGIATGRTVALKVVHPHLFRTPGFFKRFLREAELGQRIDHPNVVRTLDADAAMVEDRPQHYLVMEYVEGQTLRDLVEDVDRVPEELARHVGCEVAKALSAIHAAGAVHRDLKPENVLITKDHEVKVMDLGVARLVDEQVRLSQTGAFVGSLHYAAPEQFGGGADVDLRADLHGLGLLLYEIATGTNPFADEDARVVMRRILGEPPRKAGELNPQLSPFFEELLAQLLEKDPAARFDSASDVLGILEASETSNWWRARAKEMRAISRRPLRRIRVPRETAVFGRDDEIAALRAIYDAAEAGRGGVVLLEGEAGVGKTRLVDEFVARLRHEGKDLEFMFGSYPPGGAATAAAAFAAAYREQLGDGDGLESTLGPLLPKTPLLIPAFAARLRGDAAPPGSPPLCRETLSTCLVRSLQGLAASRTTILLIDDLHFAPDEGRSIFASLALAVPDHRVVLIGTARPGVPEDWIADLARIEHTTHLQVPRLGAKDLVELLAELFRSERLAERLGGKIALKSDGNPFFAFEIVRGLKEEKLIRQRDDGSWETTRIIEEIRVPSSVTDLVNARVARLSEDARNLLDVASCWGFEFDPTLIAEAAGVPRIAALRCLARAEHEHRIVRSVGRRMVFDHHQVQESIYEALPELLREEYHAALADTLEGRTGAADAKRYELDGALLVDLFEHYVRGGRQERVRRYADPALDHLEAVHENDRFVELAERALAAPGMLVGRMRVGILNQLGNVCSEIGRQGRRRTALEEAIELAREIGEQRAESIATNNLGTLYLDLGELDEAEPRFRRHLEYAHESQNLHDERRAIGNLGMVHMRRERNEDAEACFERELAIARDPSQPLGEAVARSHLGTVLSDSGRYDEARVHFERLDEIAEETGSRPMKVESAGNMAAALSYEGRYEEAIASCRRAREIAEEIGNRRYEGTATGHLGMLLFHVGEIEEARRLLERAYDIAAEIGSVHQTGGFRADLGRVCAAEGKLTEALGHLEDAVDSQRRAGVRGHVAEFLLPRSRVERRLGRTEAADAHLREALELGRELHMSEVVCLALAEHALSGEGDAAEAEEALERAKARLPLRSRMLAHHTLWRATADRSHLARAKELLDVLVAGAPEDARTSMLTVIPLYREILTDWAERRDGGDTESATRAC